MLCRIALFEATIEPKVKKMLRSLVSIQKFSAIRSSIHFRIVTAYILIAYVAAFISSTGATAQSINFNQSDGLVTFRSITQSNNEDHKIIGLGAGGIASEGEAAAFSGNFNSIVIDQTGTANQTFAARIAVSNSASVGFHMQNSTESLMTVDVSAGSYTSNVSISGSGRKNVNLLVDAPGKTVVQNIDVSGGPVNLRVNQTNSASLTLAYAALGSFRDTVEVNQTGLDTRANVTSTSNGASSLMLRLAGDYAEAYINANLGFGSSLRYSVFRNDVTLGSELSPANITVSDYSSVTVVVND